MVITPFGKTNGDIDKGIKIANEQFSLDEVEIADMFLLVVTDDHKLLPDNDREAAFKDSIKLGISLTVVMQGLTDDYSKVQKDSTNDIQFIQVGALDYSKTSKIINIIIDENCNKGKTDFFSS